LPEARALDANVATSAAAQPIRSQTAHGILLVLPIAVPDSQASQSPARSGGPALALAGARGPHERMLPRRVVTGARGRGESARPCGSAVHLSTDFTPADSNLGRRRARVRAFTVSSAIDRHRPGRLTGNAAKRARPRGWGGSPTLDRVFVAGPRSGPIPRGRQEGWGGLRFRLPGGSV